MNSKKKQGHFGLLLMFLSVLFLAGLINSGITTLTVYHLVHSGALEVALDISPDVGKLLPIHVLLSVPICLLVSAMVCKFPLKPIRDLINGMDQLASGDFRTRIQAGKIMERYPAYVEVARSFNKMAEELENTEMLRSDFINNFSHEFKTPIVSIAGFARLLKRDNLSEEERQQYLNAIEEESLRLSSMATNVLNMTRVENLAILTDVSQYNLSEQLRSCILLLEPKWSRRDIELELDFGEYTIEADEELMKQVWINLLDNAVKFTPDGHTISVQITRQDGKLQVAIRNTGSEIPPDSQEKIFQKFYQVDESHASRGNGIGLAIVRRILTLHQGRITVDSKNNVTTFLVEIPESQ